MASPFPTLPSDNSRYHFSSNSLALGLLLRKKTEMRPLRVYGEQAEATEFPLPGVSNRSLFGKISQEGRPNQSLRYDSSVSAGTEARGPPLARVSPRSCLLGVLPFTTGSARPPTRMQQRSENSMPSFGKGKYSQEMIFWCKWWSCRWGYPLASSLDDTNCLPCIDTGESWGRHANMSSSGTQSSCAHAPVQHQEA